MTSVHGATHFPHGVDVGCLSSGGSVSLAGTTAWGGTIGATHFPHGIDIPFLSVGGTLVYPPGTVGTAHTHFPHGIDTPIVSFSGVTPPPVFSPAPLMKVSSSGKDKSASKASSGQRKAAKAVTAAELDTISGKQTRPTTP